MSNPDTIRIATRKSALALQQANKVKDQLIAAHPGLEVELLPMSTKGDKILDAPLAKIGGKGLFIKELEQKLLDAQADIAVHSLKDVPADLPEGLTLACFCQADDPRDVAVSNRYSSLGELPAGARVGTSALRRQSQVRAAYPELEVINLRGNVNTRLAKLDAEEYDLILLAAAGLQRLGMENRISQYLEVDHFLPAVTQGVIGIECRDNDADIKHLLAPLHHRQTAIRVACERSFSAALGGSCQLPIAGHAIVMKTSIAMTGMVAMPDGSQVIKASISGPKNQAEALGRQLAKKLLQQGAAQILQYVAEQNGA